MGHTGAVQPTIVIYSRASRAIAYFVLLAAVGVTVWSLWRDGWAASAPQLPFVWAVALGGWILWGQPRLVIDEDGLRARNFIGRLTLPWETVKEVRADFGVVIDTPEGSFRLAAAQPRAGWRSLRRDPAPAQLPHIDQQAKLVKLDLDTNQALSLLNLRLEDHQDVHGTTRLLATASARVVRQLDAPVVGAIVLVLVWIVITHL